MHLPGAKGRFVEALTALDEDFGGYTTVASDGVVGTCQNLGLSGYSYTVGCVGGARDSCISSYTPRVFHVAIKSMVCNKKRIVDTKLR